MQKFTADEKSLTIPCRVYIPARQETILIDLPEIPDEALTVETLAHSLASKNRYNGHTPYPYSVATHSVLVSLLLEGNEMEGLLHDAAEAFVGDVISPIKRMIKEQFKPIEHMVDYQIRRAHGLPLFESPEVKAADIKALWLEQFILQNKNFSDEALRILTTQDLEIGRSLCSEPISWGASREIFLTHYSVVRRECMS